MQISRKDFISAPYKRCPSPSCQQDGVFGVSLVIDGSSRYSRECLVCGHKEYIDLPELKKSVVYLDQFVVSNLTKLLDKDHPSHGDVSRDPFWSLLFEKLEKAFHSQAIICPDSFYQRDESLSGHVEFRFLRRVYEHYSSGKTFHPGSLIERTQLTQHFVAWLRGEKTTFDFDPKRICFNRDLHSWSVGMKISVDWKPKYDQIMDQRQTNLNTKEQLQKIWESWRSVSELNFVEQIRLETLALGRGLISESLKFEQRKQQATQRILNGENDHFDLDDIIPPPSSDTLTYLIREAQKIGVKQSEIPLKIKSYFQDVDALLEVPKMRISSVLLASWARRASLGQKQPPKSTTDVSFISSYLPYCDAIFIDKESAKNLKELPRETPSDLRLTEFSDRIYSLDNKKDFLDYLDDLISKVPYEQSKILLDMNGENFAEPYWGIIEHEKMNDVLT